MALNTGYLTSNKENNELYTPYYAVEPILKYLPKNKVIWCPFDDEWSAYYQLLKQNRFNVIRSSLEEGQDFFAYEPEEWDLIVSNPPFGLKDKVIERLYKLNKPFAILLPLNSLQGISRFRYFKTGIQILSFDKRISFHNPNSMDRYIKGTPFASAYFCRDILPKDLILEKLVESERALYTNILWNIKLIKKGSK